MVMGSSVFSPEIIMSSLMNLIIIIMILIIVVETLLVSDLCFDHQTRHSLPNY